jgi:hypothetical protein
MNVPRFMNKTPVKVQAEEGPSKDSERDQTHGDAPLIEKLTLGEESSWPDPITADTSVELPRVKLLYCRLDLVTVRGYRPEKLPEFVVCRLGVLLNKLLKECRRSVIFLNRHRRSPTARFRDRRGETEFERS